MDILEIYCRKVKTDIYLYTSFSLVNCKSLNKMKNKITFKEKPISQLAEHYALNSMRLHSKALSNFSVRKKEIIPFFQRYVIKCFSRKI